VLTFIPTPIGNPQDITIRAIRMFEKTDLFLCEDTRHTKRLLRLLEERFDMIYPDAEFLSFNEHNGVARLEQIAGDLSSRAVVYVSDAGMPVISDPGQILVEYCQQHDIVYDVLPGASAVTTAYAASGFEEGKFLFYGFLPHKGESRNSALSSAMSSDYNVVLYESPHRLDKLLEQIVTIDPSRELFLAKELSKKFQSYYRDSASSIRDRLEKQEIRGEWVVIIRATTHNPPTLSLDEILAFDIPPKPKAKLLAKLSDMSIKEWYSILNSAK